MDAATEIEALRQILQRERLARLEAEKMLEANAVELQKTNQALLAVNRHLEATVHARTKEIESMARFAQENPDPLVRISFAGEFMQQNPSAQALLQNFVYNQQVYTAAEFWALLVQEIDFALPRWNFEAACNGRAFSFTCALHPSEGYINIYGCDVTEQRKTQQALEESEQKWHFALKAAGDGVWEYNLVTKEAAFSRSYKEMLGFEGEAFLNHERLWRSRIHPADLHLIDEIIAGYAAGRIKQHATHYRLRKRSGNYIWILDRGSLLAHSAMGQPLKIIGVHTNIDEQKKVELNLKSTAARLSTLISNLHLGITLEDEQGRRLVTNKRMTEIFALDQLMMKDQEHLSAVAQRVADLFAEPGCFLERYAEITQAKKPVLDEEWKLKDGRFISRNFIPVYGAEGLFEGSLWVIEDITERKAIEQKIQLSEKKYRDLINFSYALITTHDTEGRLLSVNPSVCRALEYTYGELIGKRITDFMLPADAAKVNDDYLQRILHNHVAEGVFRVVSKRGAVIYLLYKNYLFLEEGETPYIIGFAQDITTRIKAEKELMLAKKATDEAAVAKERFLADMSHEIRTPMNGILGLASLLEKTSLNPSQQEHLGLLKASAANLLVIVNDVLDLEKIAAGKMELEQIPFTVAGKVEASLAAFRFKIEEKGLWLKYHNGLPEELTVIGDPFRLCQLLNNLLSNALKFTADGGITITTYVQRKNATQAFITYQVIDTGMGIQADMLQTIFEPYMQARPEISRKFGGTGLGLAICKKLAEMQQGSIAVSSEEGKGSVFSFTIPYSIASTPEEAPLMPAEMQSNSLQGKRVLVAEDVQINQYLVKHFLAASGCTLTFVDNGRKAVEQVCQNNFDVVLMDIQMPEMDGTEATRAIRAFADSHKAAIPIIALTANAIKGSAEKYLAAGMNDYLSKPFTKEALLQTIERTLTCAADKVDA